MVLTGAPDHGIGSSINFTLTKEDALVKPEWGEKRTCLGCGARFYDLRRDPITCPKCDAEFKIVVVPPRSSKARASAPPKPKPEPVTPVPQAEEEETAPVADEDLAEVAELDTGDTDSDAKVDADAEEELIEDASELGEDEDDMIEVMDNVSEKEPE